MSEELTRAEELSQLSKEELIRLVILLREEREALKKSLEVDGPTGLIKTSDEGRVKILSKIESERKAGRKIALIRVDLNNLGSMNKKLGHDRVDELLIRYAKNLEDVAGDDGMAMRFHTKGDEFGLLVFDGKEEERVQKLKPGFIIDGENFTMSVGMAELQPNEEMGLRSGGEIWDRLARQADIAERRNKENIKNG